MAVEFKIPDDIGDELQRQAYRRGWDDRIKAVARNWGSAKSEKKAAASRRNGFQKGWRKKMVQPPEPPTDSATGNSDS